MKSKSGFFVRLGLVSLLGLFGCQTQPSDQDPNQVMDPPPDTTVPPDRKSTRLNSGGTVVSGGGSIT